MEYIELNLLNLHEKRSFELGTTLSEVAEELGAELPYKPLAAHINNEVVPLDTPITDPCDVRFVMIDTESGGRTYLRTLSLVLATAIHNVLPDYKLYIEHSIANGYYCSIVDGGTPQEDDIASIKEEMNRIIEADLPIKRIVLPVDEAVMLLHERGDEDAATLIETSDMLYVPLHGIEGYFSPFYGSVAPSTGVLYLYDLIPHLDGFLLRVPDRDCPERLAPIEIQPMMRNVIKEQDHLLEMLHLEYLGSVNRAIDEGRLSEMILISEAMQEKKITHIADRIAEGYNSGIRIVLISGPSSSGKTSFTNRLKTQLRTCFLQPKMISIDNYFLDRELTPRKPSGEYDFEALEAIDLKLFNSDISRLLNSEEVPLPKFDFTSGKRVYKGETMKLAPGDILLLEGIHALNPQLLTEVDETALYRVYVSCLTALGLDPVNRIATTDNRLLRRIIRDHRYRGYSAVDTIHNWDSVRAGEEQWVFPYQELANDMFNSAMVYELSALRPYAEPLLSEVPANIPEYVTARRLLRFLRLIHPVQSEQLPRASLLREFVGGSVFFNHS